MNNDLKDEDIMSILNESWEFKNLDYSTQIKTKKTVQNLAKELFLTQNQK